MRFILAALACILSAPTSAQVISLHPGETVDVRFDHGKPVVVAISAAAPVSKFEAYVIWKAQTEDVPPGAKTMPPGFVMEGEGPPSPPRPSDALLHITMRRVPGPKEASPAHTILLLSNGYGSMLRYRAVMHVAVRSAVTDVCDVAQNRLGLEHWPYIIDQLDLSDFQLLEPNRPMRCE